MVEDGRENGMGVALILLKRKSDWELLLIKHTVYNNSECY